MTSELFFSTHIPISKKTAYLFVLLALLFTGKYYSQIYNYDPIRHANFETNPSYLASEKSGNSLNFVQQNALFSTDKFHSSTVKLSAYSKKYFSGFGLMLSNTHVNDSIHYNYAGFAAAYRTIFLDKVFIKLGVLYKLIDMKTAPGNFTYYSFAPDTNETGRAKQKLNENANLSLAISSPGDKLYVSGSILNYTVPWRNAATDGKYFPQYYIVNVGDLGKLTSDGRDWEIYYTGFTKKYYGQKMFPFSHYLTVLHALNITRESKFVFGVRTGAVDNEYLQISPIFSFFQSFTRKSGIVAGLLFDFGYKIKKDKSAFPTAAQFNLTYKF